MGGDKLQLGALIPRSVGWSDGLSVCLSVLQKLHKNYKTLQNITKRYIMLQNIELRSFVLPPLPPLSLSLSKTVKEASAE